MAPPESGTIAVLAEKPSVARDIAHVLGATSKGDGYLHGNGYVVAWAIGQLVALAQPHEMNPEWRHWRHDLLPILPKRWPLDDRSYRILTARAARIAMNHRVTIMLPSELFNLRD